MSRQVDRENAARTRLGPHAEDTAIGVNAAAGDRQPQTDAAFVAADLTEGLKQLFSLPGSQSVAVVLHIDVDPVPLGVGAKDDFRARVGEFEGILEKVPDRGE